LQQVLGNQLLLQQKKVGNGGHVLATEISPQMLSIAKQRAISLGMQNIVEFIEGDAETIDLPTSTFNAELCRFGLMFLPDLKTGLSNLYRSLVHAEDYTSFVHGTAAPVRAILANETLERREEILKVVSQSVKKYADNSIGTVKLSNEAICIVGRK